MKRFSLPAVRALSSTELIVIVSVFVALFSNTAFFSSAAKIYSLDAENILFILSLFARITAVFIIMLLVVCHKFLVKPVLIVFLLLSSLITYFMNQYGIIVDYRMIDNVLETDFAEVRDLISFPLVKYVFFLGILPSVLVYRVKLRRPGRKAEWFSRMKLAGVSVFVIVGVYLAFSAQYASSFRMQRGLWAQVNPTHAIYSAGKLVRIAVKSTTFPAMIVGADAKIPERDRDRELIIMVVGESVRADHFSLNGYERETNPLLKREKIVNFPDFWSCATTTAQSVPCIFSHYTRGEFDRRKAKVADNALDILSRAGVSILWRDNNSSSKGVADRVTYESFQSPKTNPICDPECRDEGMLSGLQNYIDQRPTGDILIVLHQKGNHGPAYYKRYPAAFEKFTPVCKTSDMGACSNQEVINAYDNVILYTDYFLSRVIKLLKKNDEAFETAMVYVGDHGESLGENGLYLHALPYFLAPDTQKHVPAVMWFGRNFDRESLAGIEETRKKRLSHDNMFSTLLGLFEIRSAAYDPKMDILDHSSPENW
ncbi:MAG TPA: phosphoethanolamine--lipid A transferase [Rhizobiales bacterium]|nr:phosphoethanolamine transferase EptA [bacterium BMS3Bbin10]HDO52624.1 phosphoethanolamine--lipid A transferase [Hyphomicrobiales bacterium]